jgi:2-amino-4-hydroxy-6-hydroxymethyldihydropteridine diphosphokinase
MTTAYIALGSNMGDRLGNLSRAIDAIAHLPETHVDEISNAYESMPAYREGQAAFVNAVIEIHTGLESESLLAELLGIEDTLGRERVEENGPRTIDLDLLLFGDEERTSEALVLPHPKMLERDFVVTPLLDIAPHVTLPDGTHPRRAAATVGPIVRDLGRIPDAGAAHNMPIEETEWVAVAESEGPQTPMGGFDAGLQFLREVLEQEGIPFAFEPFEPGVDSDFLGRPRVFSLVVPAEYAERARAVIAEVEAVEPQMPPD